MLIQKLALKGGNVYEIRVKAREKMGKQLVRGRLEHSLNHNFAYATVAKAYALGKLD